MGETRGLDQKHIQMLAQRLRDDRLGLFVGAGLSHLAPAKDGSPRRLPLWKDLARQVAEDCHVEDPEVFDNPLDLFDSIVYGKETGRADLTGSLENRLDDSAFELSESHKLLRELPWSLVVTTNYDRLLERVWPKHPPVISEDDYNYSKPWLIKLHGCLKNLHTVTREDYRLWVEKHPRAVEFLRRFLATNTFLFIGYGLGDGHLDELLASMRQLYPNRMRMYAWLWQAPSAKLTLLEKRDGIAGQSIEDPEGWAAALRQLVEEYNRPAEKGREAVVVDQAEELAHRQRYVHAIESLYGPANLEAMYVGGLGYARAQITLERVFVEPDLISQDGRGRWEDIGEEDEKAGKSKKKDDREGQDNATATEIRRLRGRERAAPARQAALETLGQERRLVILGEPGSGKSTLLHVRLLEAAKQWAGNTQGAAFPVYLRLAGWETAGAPDDLVAHVREVLAKAGDYPASAVESWLKGPVMWLLDGIDEVRDTGRRSQLCDAVRLLAERRPGDVFVACARPSGYPAGGVGVGWREMTLAELTEEQGLHVLEKWEAIIRQVDQQPFDAKRVHDDLKRNAGVRDALRNPMLLTMVVLFFKANRKLPRDRYEFYEHAATVLAEKWLVHRSKQDAQQVGQVTGVHQILGHVALRMMEEGRVTLTRSRLEAEVEAGLTERGIGGAEGQKQRDGFLRSAEDLIGVMVDKGGGRFGFLHLTFQEFYAAGELARPGEARARGTLQTARRFWDHPDWGEVWRFYVLAIRTEGPAIDALFEAVLGARDTLDDVLMRPELKCLEWAGLTESPGRHVGEVWARLRGAMEGDKVWARNLGEMVGKTLGSWEQPLAEVIERWALSELKAGESWRRVRAAGALGSAAQNANVQAALVRALKDGSEYVRGRAAEALGSAAQSPRVQAALLGALKDWDWRVRRSAAGALGSAAQSPSVQPVLLRALKDEDRNERASAAEALGSAAQSPSVQGALLGALKDKSDYVRARAAESLGSAAQNANVQAALLGALKDEDRNVRGRAAAALGSAAQSPNVQAALLGALKDMSDYVRAGAAEALGSAAQSPIVQAALLGALKDKGEYVRASAAWALGSAAQSPSVQAALLGALKDEDNDVRWRAAGALGSAAQSPIVQAALLGALKDKDSDVRERAAEALARGIVARKFGGGPAR